MSKYIGARVKAFIVGVDGSGTPLVVAGQRDAEYEVSIEGIDTSSKDSTGFWNEVISGPRGWTLSFSGAHVLGDESLELLEDSVIQEEHVETTGQVQVFLETENGITRVGQALVESFSISAPHTDLTTYDVSLTGNGPLTKAESMQVAFEKVFGVGTYGPAMAKAKAIEVEKIKDAKSKVKGGLV